MRSANYNALPINQQHEKIPSLHNSLTVVFLLLFIICFYLQMISGYKVYNEELQQDGVAQISFGSYLQTGHFVSSTFENRESEFFQMGLFVWFTIFLFQRGSSESKDPDGKKEETDREPNPRKKGAPWPVKRGGIWLALYKNSLTYALFFLFIVSFILHFFGSLYDENAEILRKGLPVIKPGEYFFNARFWFESMQNWQSEFLSISAIVILSVYLRQKGSSQSKPVDMGHMECE